MHNNYYFLRQLSKQLEAILQDYELVACFSQHKNELVMGFSRGAKEFYIKAHLQPDFCCLSFPEVFHRAGKNSVDLFSDVRGKKVSGVQQFENERSFIIHLQDGYGLLFKMHGNRSNILLIRQEKPVALFKSSLANDRHIITGDLDRPIDQGREAFLQAGGEVRALFPTFGRVLKDVLEKYGYADLPLEKKWEVLSNLLSTLRQPACYYILDDGGRPVLSLLEAGVVTDRKEDPVSAINAFFYAYTKTYTLHKEKQQALHFLEKIRAQASGYIRKTTQKLEVLAGGTPYDKIAHIIMANLHQIPLNTKEVTLFNFYTSDTITVKLKPGLSPQKNAEVYYRKAKNQKIEVAHARENLETKQQTLTETEGHIAAVKEIGSLRTLRKYLADHALLPQRSREKETFPFKQFHYMDFDIWIGRNAKNNDLLTLKHAHKEDLWLHAKDVSGSHVVVKHQAGKKFPQPVIEKAAKLAAWYSKRKNDSLCPVAYTFKKFVRKRKGAPAGQVVVEKEQVILVAPEKP